MVKATQFPAKAASLKIVGLGLLGLTCPMPTGPTGPRPTMTGSFLAFPLFVSVAGISHVAGIASVGRAWLAQPELAWACQLGLPQPGWRDASWQAESLAVLAVCGWLVKAGWLCCCWRRELLSSHYFFLRNATLYYRPIMFYTSNNINKLFRKQQWLFKNSKLDSLKPVKMAFDQEFSLLNSEENNEISLFSFMRVKGRGKFESESRHLYSCVLSYWNKKQSLKSRE